VWRNLGIGCFNILHDEREAQDAFDKAFAADPKDARVLFERDQLWKRLSRPLLTRLPELERFPELVSRRDDISLELATLYNQTNQPAKALALLASRHFQPWEGGEGLAIAQYVRAHLALGRMALQDNLADKAGEHFQQALEIPQNLSEARHVLANQSNTYYWLGEACERQGRSSTAIQWWRRAASHVADFQHMAVQPFSEMTFYTALSFERLGEPAKSKSLAEELAHYARGLSREKREIDYFATSLPTMLLFDDDLNKRRKTTASVLRAQAEFLAGHTARAFGRLRRILKKEPSHEHAFDLLEELPLLAKLQLRIGVNRNV
jgi:tetratricopeptide (TPR) repeat protein